MATQEAIPADTPVATLAGDQGADTPEGDREPEAAGKTLPALPKCSR